MADIGDSKETAKSRSKARLMVEDQEVLQSTLGYKTYSSISKILKNH